MILFFDFETFWEGKYSIEELGVAAYVRDSRFKILGCAMWREGVEELSWVTDEGEMKAQLQGADEWCCHNTAFDAFIASDRLGVAPPARLLDTMGMARYAISQSLALVDHGVSLKALGPAWLGKEKGELEKATTPKLLEEYALQDVRLTRGLWELLQPLVPESMLRILDLHVRMAAWPKLHLDTVAVTKLAEADIELEPMFVLLRNDETFAAALQHLGVEPRWKVTEKGTRKLATAQTDGWLESLEDHPSPEVRWLVETRQKASSTIMRTRAQRFLRAGSPFPTPLMALAAHTGRSGGTDGLNIQNLPRKGGLRECIIPPPGYKLITADLGQIEARYAAWISGCESALEVIRLSDAKQGPDLYVWFASKYLYRVPVEQVSPDQRSVAKAAVLALGFGQGAVGFRAYCDRYKVPLPEGEEHRVVSVYRNSFPEIPLQQRKFMAEVQQTGVIRLPSGRLLTYPHRINVGGRLTHTPHRIFRRSVEQSQKDLWHGLVMENAVQAGCFDIFASQAVTLHQEGVEIVFLVHDELVAIAAEGDAERVRRQIEQGMSIPPEWAPGLPLAVEAKILNRGYEK